MQKLLLVDGNAVMHRSYHALPPFKTSKGIPTHVVYGFFAILHKALIDFQPTHLIICFDTPKDTFRNKLYKEYQIQRPQIHDDFKVQIPLVKEGLDKAGVIRTEMDGFEADDLIGTISHHFDKNEMQVLILSGDKDILQLVNDNILVISPQIGFAKTIVFNKETVFQRLGVTPKQIPDYKALAGDPSDNYKGAKGIGPKTASSLIQKFNTIENLYTNLDKVDNDRIKEILLQSKQSVLLGKKLAVILTDVKIAIPYNETIFKGFHKNLRPFLTKLEMYSIAKRLFQEKKPIEKVTKKIINEKVKPQLSLFS